MKKRFNKLILGILVATFGSFAQASDKSVTIFPAEGNVQCNDYSSNSVILKMGTTSLSDTGTLQGPENPNDADTTGESAVYTVTDGKTIGFSNATTPIDYALLKSSRDVTVLIYPSGGVTEDSNMQLVVNGQPEIIDSISLCYGLGNSAPPAPEPIVLPTCEELNQSAGLDGVGISCPTDGTTRSIVINMELPSPGKPVSFYNTTGTKMACVCNNNGNPLKECDPNATSDQPNACPVNDPNKSGLEVTTHIELNNDPYICFTIGGNRVCYPY